MELKFFILKKELTNWYGKDYREPVFKGNWVGISDEGTA